MNTSLDNGAWQPRARLILGSLAMDAGEHLGRHRALSEAMQENSWRRRDAQAQWERLARARYHGRASAEQEDAVRQELAELEAMRVDLLRRQRELTRLPDPAARLFHAAESILRALGAN